MQGKELADTAADSTSKSQVLDSGRQLSAAIRDALADADFGRARLLAVEGDGVARDLAHEYTQMHRGLGFTLRALIGQLADYPTGNDVASLIVVLTRLCSAYDDTEMVAPEGDPVAPTLAMVLERAGSLIDEGDSTFAHDQSRRADEVIAAIGEADVALALDLLAEKQSVYRRIHDPMIRFMADVFAWVLAQSGPSGLVDFHVETASQQRAGFEKWEHLPADEFARVTAFLLRQHLGEIDLSEDSEKYTIHQSPCGSGGQLQLNGAYTGRDALPVVQTPGPLTFGETRMPVYCTHCAIWNGSVTLRWFGRAQWVFENPAQPDGTCTLHIYKSRTATPEDYVRRVSLPDGGAVE